MQATHLLARAKVQKGEYDAAQEAFEQTLNLSQQLGESSTTCLAHEDLGLLFIKQGRYPEALPHVQESYAIAKSLDMKKNVVLSLIDRANALWRLGRYDDARAVLKEASPSTEGSDAVRDLSATYYLAVARLALSERQFSEARAKAQKVLDLAADPLKNLIVPATFIIGSAQAFSGSSRQGQFKCQEAVEMARQSGDPFLLSDALLSLGQAMIESGNSAGALTNALESQELFAWAGRKDNEWLAWLIAARASRSAGDSQKSGDYASRAQDVLSGLQQKWGDDSYNTYLNRPDVKFSRKQLSEFFAGKS
jgi:tetratricopeptide (TPR) repeat protein